MALGDIYQVTTFFDFQGNTNNVYIWYFIEASAATTGTDEAALIAFFEVDLLPTLAIGLDENLIFTCIEAKRVLRQDVKIKESTLGEQKTVSIAGTITLAEALPGQCSLVIQTLESEESTGATARGRDFYTGFVEGDQADGIWLDATQDRVTGQLDSEFTNGAALKNGGAYGWQNWSNKKYALRLAGGGPPFLEATTDIQVLRPLNHVRTQRRRQSLNPCDLYGTIVDMS